MMAMSPYDALRLLLEEHEKETANYLITGRASEEIWTIRNSNSNSSSIDRCTNGDSSRDSFEARFNNNDDKNSGFHDGCRRADRLVRKLDHNAKERDRRNRINKLYSDLRSLLPADDGSGKLSIPAIISRVLKYIPELQREVERLAKRKENLIMSKISSKEDDGDNDSDDEDTGLSMNLRKEVIKRRRTDQICSSAAVLSITQMADEEIIIQISVPRIEKGSCCGGALAYLEMEAFLVLSASCFKSFDGRVFCNIHIQAQESQIKDVRMLKEKIWSFFEQKEKN